ncbi:hypothetical protein D3C85_1656540 [compost metagenome]
MPILLPAPARFSTTMGCLTAAPSFSASARAKMSVACPGGNGTIRRMGRSGYSAWAGAPATASARPAARLERIRFMIVQ